jgi:hypothetical protein
LFQVLEWDHFDEVIFSFENFVRENALVKEIFQLSPFIENPSLFNYLVISFYDRDLSPYLFVKQARTIKGAVYLAVRYLYIMLLSFEDLKKLKNPDDLAEELTNALEGNPIFP